MIRYGSADKDGISAERQNNYLVTSITFLSYLFFRKRWDFFNLESTITSHRICFPPAEAALLLGVFSGLCLFFLCASNTIPLEDNRIFEDIGSITDFYHPTVQGKIDITVILLKYLLLH